MAPFSSQQMRLWARDFSIVGAACGFLAPLTCLGSHELPYALSTGIGGMAAGAVLGPLSGALISLARRRLPKIALISFGLILGGLWGGMAGAAPEYLGGTDFKFYSWALSILTSAVAGSVLGWWFWLAYAYRRINQRSAWPVVLAGCAQAPTLAIVGNRLLFWHQYRYYFVALPVLVVPWVVLLGWYLLRRSGPEAVDVDVVRAGRLQLLAGGWSRELVDVGGDGAVGEEDGPVRRHGDAVRPDDGQ